MTLKAAGYGANYTYPAGLERLDGFSDESYGNDSLAFLHVANPFSPEGEAWTIWIMVDSIDRAGRELGPDRHRFAVWMPTDIECIDGIDLFETEDPEALLSYFGIAS